MVFDKVDLVQIKRFIVLQKKFSGKKYFCSFAKTQIMEISKTSDNEVIIKVKKNYNQAK